MIIDFPACPAPNLVVEMGLLRILLPYFQIYLTNEVSLENLRTQPSKRLIVA